MSGSSRGASPEDAAGAAATDAAKDAAVVLTGAEGDGPAVDWPALRDAARAAMARAYAPYSNFPVGAAALVDDGRIVTGANVENASYGCGLCAECGLVSELALTGGGRLVAFTCCDGEGELLMPCGRCRQLLNEFKAPGMRIDTPRGILPFDGILPQAFGPDDLA